MSSHQLDALVRAATDAIVTADARGVITGWNPAAERTFGYLAEEVVGRPLTIIIPERFREAYTAGLARVAAGGEGQVIGSAVELAALHRDGREIPIELSLSTWESDGERCFAGIIRDITERARLNTGYCTVGSFGSEERLDYTIVGGQVNAAARLEVSAEVDQILVSHQTWALIKDRIECRPVGEIEVKGIAHPLLTYEVLGEIGPEAQPDDAPPSTAGTEPPVPA